MAAAIYLCFAVTLVTSCLAAPRRDLEHHRHQPSLLDYIFAQVSHPAVSNVTHHIITIYNTAILLDQLDYDQLLALLEEYFKGR